MRNLASLKGRSSEQSSGNRKNGNFISKRSQTFNGTFRKNNHPYPESGHLHRQERRHSQTSSANGPSSLGPVSSYGSLPTSNAYTTQEREGRGTSHRSGAPTVATNPETIHSDAGHSKAATSTTRGGALSSIDGARADSTFSSPQQSQHSLATTLTTIQSTGAPNSSHAGTGNVHVHHHGSLNNPNPVMFSHQYPVTGTAVSAIPRHMADAMPNTPNTYSSATANGLLSDNASILTLASSSKRRRRSMDTDASVRALPPGSMFGGSRESLPLSVLSGNVDAGIAPAGFHSQSRPSIGGLASAERASIYSAQGGGPASERNSYYSYKPGKDVADGKSLRSLANADARSVHADQSIADVASVRSGALGHGRNDSIPGVVSAASVKRGSGTLSRRSSDWPRADHEEDEGNFDEPGQLAQQDLGNQIESERRNGVK